MVQCLFFQYGKTVTRKSRIRCSSQSKHLIASGLFQTNIDRENEGFDPSRSGSRKKTIRIIPKI
jgi:hypothetical protein